MRGDCMADYHPEHNATLAFMYGPLVLAGINVTSDIWIPRGGTVAAKQNPASFISRVQPAGDSKHTLSFKATAQVRCHLRRRGQVACRPRSHLSLTGRRAFQDGSAITLIPLKDVMAERYQLRVIMIVSQDSGLTEIHLRFGEPVR
jgi:hypothetical protein